VLYFFLDRRKNTTFVSKWTQCSVSCGVGFKLRVIACRHSRNIHRICNERETKTCEGSCEGIVLIVGETLINIRPLKFALFSFRLRDNYVRFHVCSPFLLIIVRGIRKKISKSLIAHYCYRDSLENIKIPDRS